jgi:hypothetical protein
MVLLKIKLKIVSIRFIVMRAARFLDRNGVAVYFASNAMKTARTTAMFPEIHRRSTETFRIKANVSAIYEEHKVNLFARAQNKTSEVQADLSRWRFDPADVAGFFGSLLSGLRLRLAELDTALREIAKLTSI